VRCKACDKILEPEEIVWYPAENRHEELCRGCLIEAGLLVNEGTGGAEDDDEDDAEAEPIDPSLW
jgi:hypothetical protein